MKSFRKSLLFVCFFINFISVQTSNKNEPDDETSFPQELDLKDLFSGGINFLKRKVNSTKKLEDNQNNKSYCSAFCYDSDFDSYFSSDIDSESDNSESSQNLKLDELDKLDESDRALNTLNLLNETSIPHETIQQKKKKQPIGKPSKK